MKKQVQFFSMIFLLSGLIVLPVICSVNHAANNLVVHPSLAASGSPIPAPVPHGTQVLSASGSPIPAPVPHGTQVLSASGSPIPAPVPFPPATAV